VKGVAGQDEVGGKGGKDNPGEREESAKKKIGLECHEMCLLGKNQGRLERVHLRRNEEKREVGSELKGIWSWVGLLRGMSWGKCLQECVKRKRGKLERGLVAEKLSTFRRR